MLLTPAQIKPKSFESRRNSFFLFFFLFLPGVDALHVYMRAWALGCFHSLISTQTVRRALTASVDSCAEIPEEWPFSGVTKSGTEFGGRCRKAMLGVWVFDRVVLLTRLVLLVLDCLVLPVLDCIVLLTCPVSASTWLLFTDMPRSTTTRLVLIYCY